jgi:hypothetical protein
MDFFVFVRRATRRDRVLAFLALAFAAQNAFAIVLPKTRHVGPSATNCDFTTIKDAIDAANSGDTILIDAGGTYAAQHLTIDKSLAIGAGACQLVIGGKPDTAQANPLVTISGNSGAVSAVITVTGAASVSLNDLKITGNTNANDGGGIEHTSSGKLTLNNVTVTGNTGKNGGGVDVVGTADLQIGNDTQIVGNTANLAGGGIRFASTGNLTASGTGNLIGNNHAPNSFGGGLFIDGGVATLTATGIGSLPLFYLNNAASGGGIAIRGAVTQTAALNLGDVSGNAIVIDNNVASIKGGGLYLLPYDDGTFRHAARISAFNVRLTTNAAPDGAALYADCPNGAATCANFNALMMETDGCTGAACSAIRGNIASSPNGAVVAAKSTYVELANTRVENNSGAYVAHLTSDAQMLAVESLFDGNSTTQELMFSEGSILQIYQSTLGANDVGAMQLLNVQGVEFDMVNSVAFTNLTLLKQSNLAIETVNNVVSPNINGLPVADDIVLGDPVFVDSAHGDYRLRVATDGKAFSISPAVDFSASNDDSQDIDGRARPKDVPNVTNRFGAYDLGAFEMQPIIDRVFANAFGDPYLLAQ